MESNHRSLVVTQASSPLDHRVFQSSRQELNLPRPAYQTGASPLGHGWGSGRDRTRTCKGCSPRPLSKRVPSCLLARPSVTAVPAGLEPAPVRLGTISKIPLED